MLDHFRMILKKKKATSSRRQAELDNDSKVGGGPRSHKPVEEIIIKHSLTMIVG